MRIIAGTRRGRLLVTPKGKDTRPTRGRIRESIFNIIQNEIMGAAVLDLFAGSGAMGLEALSRGAARAVFVDNARPARDAIEKNIRSLQMGNQARLLCLDYTEALCRLRREELRFDIIFLDPPYDLAGTDGPFSQIQKSGVMKRGALLIYEHAKRNVFVPVGLNAIDERSYGETSVTFMKEIPEA